MDQDRNPTDSHSYGYSDEQVREFIGKLHELECKQDEIQLDVLRLAGQLKIVRAKTFASEGVARRLQVLGRAAINIYRIYSPDRNEFLNKEEGIDIAINFHAFAINLYALFDNVAWVAILEAGHELPPMKIGPYKPETQQHFPPDLVTYLEQETMKTWFDKYGKLYRDSTAHRIAPYLPLRTYTPEASERWQTLDALSMKTLFGGKNGDSLQEVDKRLAEHEKLEHDKASLGGNSVLMGTSLTGKDANFPVYFHPQLLCDWGMAQEFIQAFTISMRKQYKFQGQ